MSMLYKARKKLSFRLNHKFVDILKPLCRMEAVMKGHEISSNITLNI